MDAGGSASAAAVSVLVRRSVRRRKSHDPGRLDAAGRGGRIPRRRRRQDALPRHGVPDDTKLVLTLEGHHPQQVDVVTTGNGGLVVFGILLWGPFELLVDALANAWYSVDERPLLVPMTPTSSPAPQPWSLPVKMWRRGGAVVPK